MKKAIKLTTLLTIALVACAGSISTTAYALTQEKQDELSTLVEKYKQFQHDYEVSKKRYDQRGKPTDKRDILWFKREMARTRDKAKKAGLLKEFDRAIKKK